MGRGCGSWVVGRGSWVVGRGSWVKKSIEKRRELKKKLTNYIEKNCKTHETKISTYTPAPFPFSAFSKANIKANP